MGDKLPSVLRICIIAEGLYAMGICNIMINQFKYVPISGCTTDFYAAKVNGVHSAILIYSIANRMDGYNGCVT